MDLISFCHLNYESYIKYFYIKLITPPASGVLVLESEEDEILPSWSPEPKTPTLTEEMFIDLVMLIKYF